MIHHSVRLFYAGLAFKDFSPFYEKFNTKIDEMISSGSSAKLRREFLNPHNDPYEDTLGPQVAILAF